MSAVLCFGHVPGNSYGIWICQWQFVCLCNIWLQFLRQLLWQERFSHHIVGTFVWLLYKFSGHFMLTAVSLHSAAILRRWQSALHSVTHLHWWRFALHSVVCFDSSFQCTLWSTLKAVCIVFSDLHWMQFALYSVAIYTDSSLCYTQWLLMLMAVCIAFAGHLHWWQHALHSLAVYVDGSLLSIYWPFTLVAIEIAMFG